jgi:hypothetical protein
MCPANSVWDVKAQRCLFKKADSTTKCQPGYILLRRGSVWRCVPRQVTETTCQPGWVYSRRLYKCVPGFVPGTNVGEATPGRRVCGYGRVWSDTEYRCVKFRTGGGTDGGSSGSYNCGPGERWSNSQYRCVPRRDRDRVGGGTDGGYNCGPGERWSNSQYRCVPRRGGDGPAIGLGGSGINIYIVGSKKKRGDDGEYARGGRGGRDGGRDGGWGGGGGEHGYRGSGGNDNRGRGR